MEVSPRMEEPSEFRQPPRDPAAVLAGAAATPDDGFGDPIAEGRQVGGEKLNVRTEVKQREHVRDLRRTIQREVERADGAERRLRAADDRVLKLSVGNQRLRDRLSQGSRRDAALSFLTVAGGALVSLFPFNSTGAALVGTGCGMALLLGAGTPLILFNAVRHPPDDPPTDSPGEPPAASPNPLPPA